MTHFIHHIFLAFEFGLDKKLNSLKKNERTLNHLKKSNVELEKDVESVHQRDELRAKAKLMEKKLAWLKYDMKQAEYREAKEREKTASKEFEKAINLLNKLKEPIKKQKDEKDKLYIGKRLSTNHLIMLFYKNSHHSWIGHLVSQLKSRLN